MLAGVAVKLLGLFLLLQGCLEVRAEIGGRHIRRITAADLPSSNSTDTTKIRLKKLQAKGGENCTKAGSCGNPTTPAPHSTPSGKTVSSFLSDDVLQERLRTDLLSYLTTTRSPYVGDHGSYFDGNGFNDRTAHTPKKSSFSNKRHTGTEAMNFDAPLTTPVIKLFDDFHAKMTEGIRQNLEKMDENMFRDVMLQDDDKTLDGHQTEQMPARIHSSGDPTEKTSEKVALEFLSNFSVVYNNSDINNSLKREVVVENGTHIDFDYSRVQTKVEPEVNRTVFYILNGTNSTLAPPSEAVSTDSTNDTHGLQTDTTERFLAHLNTAANHNLTQNNNTGTPGDKESTTSESTMDRPIPRSHISRNNSSILENLTPTSNEPIKLMISNETKAELTNIEKQYSNEDTMTSSNGSDIMTKDPKSNTVGPVFTERKVNRDSGMLASRRDQQNSTDGLEQSSQIPLSGLPENSYSNEDARKKPRARYNLLRNGTNISEEQAQSSTASVSMTTGTVIPSTQATEANGFVSETASDARDIQNNTNPTSANGFTDEQEESSTPGCVSIARGRRSTYRCPDTASVGNTTDASDRSSTVRNSTSIPSANVEAIRRRTTSKRRPNTSTETSVTLLSSSTLTTESNVIIRGLPVTARRTSLSNETDNREGNDIISVRNNVYTPVTRNRGSIRYGSQKSDVSGGARNASYSSSVPTTSVTWTLVSRKGPDDQTRTLRQDNSTSDAHVRRWAPTRGRRPWNSEGQGKYLYKGKEWIRLFNYCRRKTRQI
jgi:hypothetical protein